MIQDAPSESAGLKQRKPRRRVAAGPARPQYLESRDLDKVTMMLIALISEVSANRDRLDTMEALLEQRGGPAAADIETFRLTADRAAVRGERRAAMMKRVFRVLLEDLDPGDENTGAST